MGNRKKMRILFVVLAVALVATADELKDLSSADAPTPVKDVAKNDQNDLGEEEGNFGGALMTSGSFTMMAAGGTGFQEEELGEGEGNFGGALMTSGSFTMMATGGTGFQEE